MPTFPIFFCTASLPLYQAINIGLVALLPIAMAAAAFRMRRDRIAPEPARAFPSTFDVWSAATIVLAFLALCILPAIQGGVPDRDNWFSVVLSQILTVVLLSPAIIRVASHPARSRTPNHKAAWFFGGLFGGYFFIILYGLSGWPEFLTSITHSPAEQAVITTFGHSSPVQQIVIAASAIVAAPLLEETFFRGYLYPVVKRFTGVWPAMIGVSLFFGAVHMSLVQFLPLAFFGFVLNLAYEATGCLRLSMAMHAAFNTIGIALVYAAPYLQEYVNNHS